MVVEALRQATAIHLKDKNLRKSIRPLLTALNRSHNTLQTLNLSGNFITDDCIDLMCKSFPSLENLKSLDLSLNHLTAEGIKNLSTAFQQNPLHHLTELNLSHNELGNESLSNLSLITRYLNLETLKLIDVGFTADIFNEQFDNARVELCLDYVKHLDISYNELNKDDVIKFVRCVSPKNLEYLNVGNNKVTEEGFLWELVKLLDSNNCPCLKNIDLSRCMISDYELYELLR